MAKMFGIFRLGRDAELRFTPSGKAVANVALAYSYGQAGIEGKRPTQWIEASIWDKRAEALTPYLLKGNQIGATISDIHIETYEGAKGAGHKLVGRIDDIELTDKPKDDGQPRQAPKAAPPQAAPAVAPRAPSSPSHAGSFDDGGFDDIPF